MAQDKSLDEVFERLVLMTEKHGADDNGLWDDTETLIWELRNKSEIVIDRDKISNFSSIIDELRLVADRHRNSLDEFNAITQNAPKVSYCVQSKYMHRGCYCPSPMLDLLIDNVRRGKSAEKLPKAKKGYYKYYFDASGILVTAEKYDPSISAESPHEIEHIIREEAVEYGLTFVKTDPPSIMYLSKACYENDLIKSYAACLYNEHTPKAMWELHYEEYSYSGARLMKADVYFGISPHFNSYDMNECSFKYDDSGKIYEFDVMRQFQGKPTSTTYCHHNFRPHGD